MTRTCARAGCGQPLAPHNRSGACPTHYAWARYNSDSEFRERTKARARDWYRSDTDNRERAKSRTRERYRRMREST